MGGSKYQQTIISGSAALIVCAALILVGGVMLVTRGASQRPPRAKFPAVVDLGVQELGSIVTCRIPFENLGGKTLVVSDVSTSCSCAGFEIETEAGSQAVRSFSVRRGEVVPVNTRVAVRSQGVGERVSLDVNFRTNDPDQPQARLQIVVTEVRGGVTPVPDRVGFGEVAVGKKAEQFVDIWDSRKPPRKIALHPLPDGSPVSAELVGVDRSPTPNGAVPDGMTYVGKLLIRLDTSKEIAFNGAVAVSPEGEDRKPDVVSVFANVVRPVVCSPSVLVLPVTSGPNRRYEGAIMLRALDGRSITQAEVVRGPEWCECALPEGWSNSHGVIKVKVDPQKLPGPGLDSGEALAGRLIFSVRVGEDDFIAEAEVRVMP